MSKSFFNFREEHGAGDFGSDKLVNKYKADTPGQGGDTGEKKQKARKGDMLQNKDEPEKSLKTEETLDELKKYDKNADFRVLNKLSQKQKSGGNLTPAEKKQMANAKARLRNHGVKEEVELDEKFSWNDVNKALTKANYMRGSPAEIEKVASKFKYKSGNDKNFSLADVKKNLSAAGIDAKRQHNVMKHMNESTENIMENLPKEKFQSAEAKLVAYAKKNGGVDKSDFMDIAKMCGQIGRINILQAGQVLARLNRKVDGLDTDVRDKVFEIMKSVDLMEEVEKIDEAKFTDKQIKMACGIANDKRYKGGNMTGAVKAIEKIAKGLSDHPKVQKVLRAANEDTDMEAIIDALIVEELMEMQTLEENYEESSMMQNQIDAMEHFLDGIDEYIEECEDCPEWFQNKLTMAFSQLQSLYSYATGQMDDEQEMEESTKAYGDAMRKQARDKQMDRIKDREKDKLMKIRKMLDKEKKRK